MSIRNQMESAPNIKFQNGILFELYINRITLSRELSWSVFKTKYFENLWHDGALNATAFSLLIYNLYFLLFYLFQICCGLNVSGKAVSGKASRVRRIFVK